MNFFIWKKYVQEQDIFQMFLNSLSHKEYKYLRTHEFLFYFLQNEAAVRGFLENYTKLSVCYFGFPEEKDGPLRRSERNLTVDEMGDGEGKGNQQKPGERARVSLCLAQARRTGEGSDGQVGAEGDRGAPQGSSLERGRRCLLTPERRVRGHAMQAPPPISRGTLLCQNPAGSIGPCCLVHADQLLHAGAVRQRTQEGTRGTSQWRS